ncbi:hypothetical protein XELAEV_18024577mg [Xenopus laevis]|uniref:Lymphatic vessel endothelial hyaluronic acid receptor 1 n=1 Tax=Xenopus laevis TaxID=8355 RepID=A0A974HL44_XENLA|nr:hypothetical protein XELAEV_18024577mg [Xenopus laevis]
MSSNFPVNLPPSEAKPIALNSQLSSKMTSITGYTIVLLSILLTRFVVHCVIPIKDLAHSPCRFAGVLLAESSEHKYKFNFTTAESVCRVLGLQLASKDQVEKANKYGFETCSFGWVLERIVVISRIQSNEKCGQNKTGLVPWSIVNTDQKFHAYCFNASDTWKNSCKPDPLTTLLPDTSMAPSSTAESVQSSAYDTTTETISVLNKIMSTHGYVKTTLFLPPFTATQLTATQLTATQLTATQLTATQLTATFINDLLEKDVHHTDPYNVQYVSGCVKIDMLFPYLLGLPAALLTLVLIFFIASVVLAVCYIKQYKVTKWLFTKKEERESVETKEFKENTNTEQESTKEEGKMANKKSEVPQGCTGNSMEAEV